MNIDCQACGVSCQVVSYEDWLGIRPLFCPFCGEDLDGEVNMIQEGEAEAYLERLLEPELGESLDDTELL